MIWNPIVSVVIFLIISVPSIWIGFKKGWKSALLISLTLLVLNFIVLGIGILLYDKIWYGYKILFFKNNHKININLEVLKNAYKPRVLLLLCFFSVPIVWLLTWCIHLLTKNVLTKHWMPKTQKISKNNKKILLASNSKKSKIIGGGILALSSVFVSSFVVSGVNVLTMPLHRKNSFSKGTDWLGKIYSAGIANNSDVPFYIDNFMEKADNDVTQGLSSLISFVDSANESDIYNNLQKSEVIKTKSSLFNEIFKSPEASSKIIESILSNDNQFINPLLWNEDVYKAAPDKYGNEQGYNDSLLNNGNKRVMFLEQLKNYLSLNPFKYSMPQEVRNVYIKLFKKYIDNWGATKFVKYLKVAQNYINQNDNDLKDQKSEYKEIKVQKINLTKTRNERVDKIENLMSASWKNRKLQKKPIIYKNVKNYDYPEKSSNYKSESNWEKFTWIDGFNMQSSYFAQGSNNINGTEIENQYNTLDVYIKDETNKRTLATKAEQERSIKEKSFLTVNTSTYDYDSAKKHLNSLKTDLDDNRRDLATWDEKHSHRKSRRDEIAVTLLPDLLKNISDKNDEINNLQKKLSLENVALDKLKEEEKKAMNDYNDSLSNFNRVKASFESIEKNYLSAKLSLQSLNDSSSQEETNLSNTEWELKDVKSQLSNLKQNNQVSNKKKKLENDISRISNIIESYKKQINDRKNTIDNIKTQMDNLEIEKKESKNIRDDNYSTYSNKVDKVNSQAEKIKNISLNVENTKKYIANFNVYKTDLDKEKQKLENNPPNFGSINAAQDKINYFYNMVTVFEQKYNDFKILYDPEYRDYKNLKEKEEAAYKIAKDAKEKRGDQDKKIKKSINDVIKNIAWIDQDNQDIKAKAKEISIYDNSEVSTILKNNSEVNQFLFSKDNQEESLKISPNARKSLGYFEAKLNAMKERLDTCKAISNRLEKKFNQMVEKLVNIYSDWINKK